MAGAGYKLFNTGDVLTAAQVNTYLMEQTVMVFADAAARTAALSGVVSEGMISYLKDTNAVEVYNGSAWVASDDPNAIQNTIVDAKGDLITATAADTPARLAVGANDLVLTADSSASTGLAYKGGWTTWTPSIANFTLGNGSITGRYAKVAKTVFYYVRIVFGTTTSFTGFPALTLPITPNNQEGTLGTVFIDDPGTAGYLGAMIAFGGAPYVCVGRSDATFLKYEIINATVPMTWGNGDCLTIRGTYEVA